MSEKRITSEDASCPLIQDLLPLYLDDEVSHESHLLITQHLAGCVQCSSFLAGARTMHDLLRREQQMRTESIAGDHDQQIVLAGKHLVIITAIVVIAVTAMLAILSPMFFNPPGM